MRAISRRTFLTNSAVAAGALVMNGALAPSAWADPLGLPIGIQLYTVGADMRKDAADAIRQIAAIGYKEVETAGFGSFATAAELRKVLDDNGLKCPSAHLQFDLDNLQKTFDDANALGCRYATASVARRMIMPRQPAPTPGAPRPQAGSGMAPMQADELKRLADAMNTVGAAAKKSGLLFASHNHTEQFASVNGETGFDVLMKSTDPDTVKFEIDCGWMTVAGFKPGYFVNKYPGRVKMLHIKDFLAFEKGAVAGGPGSPKGSEIGQGVVNYKEIFAEVKGKGIDHIFVEQEGPYSRMPPMEAAKADYTYLHSI